MQGETVDFSITSGDANASLGSTSETTGHNGQVGQAQTTLILGNNASGSYTIEATSNEQSVTGTATVTSPPPTIYSIHVISAPGSGAPGDTLTFVVEVRADGIAKEGETVTFSITSGDGNASLGTPNPATTGNDGQAEIELTLGDSASDSYTITATSQGQSVSGTATVTSGDGNGNSNGNGNNGRNNGGNNGGGNNQEPDIPQRTDPESEEAHRFMFQLSLYAGWNFIHIPLEVTHVDGKSMSFETVGNLFQVLMPDQMYIYDPIDFHDGSHWLEVFGDSELELGPNQGVAVYMDAPVILNLVGSPLPPTFSLEPSMNFVGIPRQSSDLQKVSDFLTFYPKTCVVLVEDEGELYVVWNKDDPGDIEITGGQAFLIVSLEHYTTEFDGEPWGKVFAE